MPPAPTPAPTPTPTPPGTTPPLSSDQFMQAIQSKLLDQSGIVSSSNSDLQNSLQQAVAGYQTSQADSDQATTLDYNQQIQQAQQAGSQTVTNGLASSGGGVINMAALNAVTDNIDKNVNDLEQKKQEAILQNDSATASKISDMQMQALQFKQTAQTQAFSQLLQLGQFGITAQNAQNANIAAQNEQTSAIGDLITANPQAGIKSTDTLDQAYAKIGADPNSPDLQLKKAQIAQIYNNIATGGTKTDQDKITAGVQNITSALVPGATMTDGTPVIDPNGFITPTAWKAAINQAPTNNLTRAQFISNFGHLLAPTFDKNGKPVSGSVSSEYGLTPAEQKIIDGTLPATG